MTAAASTTGDKAQLVAWQQQPSSEQDIYARAIRPGGLQSTTITYDYDPLYRLTTAVYTGALSATYEYLYDGVGNMTAYTETAGITTTIVSRTFDDANRLLTALDTESGTTSYYWDDNGNLIQTLPPGATGQNPVNAISYGYNQRNLLITSSLYISGTGWLPQAAFAYDGGGDRLQQTDFTSGGPITTTYTNDIIGLTQVLVSDNGLTTIHMFFGLDLIAQDDGTDTRILLADGLGTVRTEMVGNAIETTTTYEPYGKLLAQTGSKGTVYGYTGEAHDDSTGLVFLRARYYSPNIRLFLSKDAWAGSLDRSVSRNAWVYSFNNPVNFIDPSGHVPKYSAIGDGFSYSCNCGWIDWGHAGPGTAKDILRKVYVDPLPMNSNYKVINVSMRSGIVLPVVGLVAAGVTKQAVVRTSLNHGDQQRVALSIFMELTEEFEAWQGTVGLQFESSFSEEDLASNLIGFYVARDLIQLNSIDRTIDDRKIDPEELRRMVDPRCLTLNKQQSKDVFNEPYGNFETVKTWANPRLKSSCLIDGFCGVDRGWPAHYNAIHPEPPMRHGKWWWWAGADQDGMLMSTDIAGVNYLGPIPSPAPTPPLIGTHTP